MLKHEITSTWEHSFSKYYWQYNAHRTVSSPAFLFKRIVAKSAHSSSVIDIRPPLEVHISSPEYSVHCTNNDESIMNLMFHQSSSHLSLWSGIASNNKMIYL